MPVVGNIYFRPQLLGIMPCHAEISAGPAVNIASVMHVEQYATIFDLVGRYQQRRHAIDVYRVKPHPLERGQQ